MKKLKQFTVVLMALVIVFTLIPKETARAYSITIKQGNSFLYETSQPDLVILSAEEFMDFINELIKNPYSYSGKYVCLGADIVFDKNTVNNYPQGQAILYGIFDGRGHSISGINCDDHSTTEGLFDYVEGQIKDLVVKDCKFVSDNASLGGVIAGNSRGTIEYCTIENCELGGGLTIGGIVGYTNGYVNNCYNMGVNVYGDCCVGGIVGNGNAIRNCVSVGTVVCSSNCSTDSFVGGIAGKAGEIYNCVNLGSVGCESYPESYVYVGGIVGDGSTMHNSYNAGLVYSHASNGLAGALAGEIGSANNSYYLKTVTVPAFGSLGSEANSSYSSLDTTDMSGEAFLKTLNQWVDQQRELLMNGSFHNWRFVHGMNYPEVIPGHFVILRKQEWNENECDLVSNSAIMSGEKVYFSIPFYEDYRVVSVKIVTASGKEVPFQEGADGHYFIMPDETVEIVMETKIEHHFTRCNFQLDQNAFVYDGKKKKPTVTGYFNDYKLVQDKDYKLEYVDNVYPGMGKVIITGIGDFEGTRELTFYIYSGSVNCITGEIDYVYDGKAKMPAVKVYSEAGTLLKENQDYYLVYFNNVNAGEAYVEAHGINNYGGIGVFYFTINPAKIGNAVLSKKTYVYDGKSKKPTVTVTDKKGKVISENTYKVTYDSGRKNVGKYKIKVAMSGNYTGTKSLYFTINPAATTIKTVTPASKAFTVTWAKKTTQVDGYEVQYCTSDQFKDGVKKVVIKKNTTTSTKVKDLKSKKKYFVRVRTYKKVGTVKFYSGWSKTLKVTTK